jgi:hypothetical protein
MGGTQNAGRRTHRRKDSARPVQRLTSSSGEQPVQFLDFSLTKRLLLKPYPGQAHFGRVLQFLAAETRAHRHRAPAMAVLQKIGGARDAPPAQIALAWQLSRPWVSSVIVGATSLAQLEANLKASALVLENEELARLDEVSAFQPRYPKWMQGMARDEKTAQSPSPTLRPRGRTPDR